MLATLSIAGSRLARSVIDVGGKVLWRHRARIGSDLAELALQILVVGERAQVAAGLPDDVVISAQEPPAPTQRQ